MLQQFLEQLCAELDISPAPTMSETKTISFHLGDSGKIDMRDLEPGCSFASTICPCPLGRREELFLELMRANYLGQATGASRIGMSDDEKFLTLSLSMPYETSYRTFREMLEEFVNFLIYWRDKIAQFEQQSAIV